MVKKEIENIITLCKENNIDCFPIFHTEEKFKNKVKLSSVNYLAIHEKHYWKIRKLLNIKTIWRRKLELNTKNSQVFIYFIKPLHPRCFAYYDYVKHCYTKERTVEIRYYSDLKSKDNNVIDKKYRQVTVIVPTIYREEKVIDLLKSLYDNEDSRVYKVYIGDQSEFDNLFLKHFIEQLNHKYFNIEYNAGLSKTRNELIAKAQSPYCFITDDDTVFTSSNLFSKMESILLERKSIGLCGGQFANRFPYLNLYKQKNYYDYVIFKKDYQFSSRTIKYCYADCVTNFFLAKKEFLNQVKWQDHLKLGEHVPFFLDIKKTHWKVTYTPEVTCDHNPKQDNTYYLNHNQNNRSECYNNFYKQENIRTTYTRDFREKDNMQLKYAVIGWDKIEVYEQIKGWNDERYNHYFNYFPNHKNIVINLQQSETKRYKFKNFTVYDCASIEDFIKIIKQEKINFLFTWNCETDKLDWCVEASKITKAPLIAMPVSTQNLKLKSLAKADLVICISDAIKQICSRNINSNKLEVIPIGLSPNVFYPIDMHKNKNLVISTLGRGCTPSKNWYNTAKALQLLSKKQKITWLVCGSKTDKIIDFNTNLSYNLKDFETKNLTIEHLGVLSAKNVNEIYNKSDIFCLASIYEGQGLVWFESWLTHTPVATSNISPMNTYVKEGINGELFNPNSIFSIYKTLEKMSKQLDIYTDYEKSVKGFTVDDVLIQRENIFDKHIQKQFITYEAPIEEYTKEEEVKIPEIISNYNYIIKQLNEKNIDYCLLRNTCFDAIHYGGFTTELNNIYLGVKQTDVNLDELLKDLPYKNIQVHFLPYPSKVKPWGKWYNMTKVPIPVLVYLKSIRLEKNNANFKSR